MFSAHKQNIYIHRLALSSLEQKFIGAETLIDLRATFRSMFRLRSELFNLDKWEREKALHTQEKFKNNSLPSFNLRECFPGLLDACYTAVEMHLLYIYYTDTADASALETALNLDPISGSFSKILWPCDYKQLAAELLHASVDEIKTSC